MVLVFLLLLVFETLKYDTILPNCPFLGPVAADIYKPLYHRISKLVTDIEKPMNSVSGISPTVRRQKPLKYCVVFYSSFFKKRTKECFSKSQTSKLNKSNCFKTVDATVLLFK
jgi:hypothetical protein